MFEVLAITASVALVRDIAADPSGVTWVATEGGLLAVDEFGAVAARDTRVRGLEGVSVVSGTLWVETDGGWQAFDEARDAWSAPLPVGPVAGDDTGPHARSPQDVAVFSSQGWSFAGNALFDAQGARVGAVPGKVAEVVGQGNRHLVRTVEGELFSVGDHGVDAVERPGPCGNFVTGLTRWNGDLVVGTFDRGACVRRDDGWTTLALPSTMVNEVLAVPSPDGEVLWVATSEGLVRFAADGGRETFVAVPDGVGKGAPGLNHAGANHLSWDGAALWVADVLGPTRIAETSGARTWSRFRWSVSGHSYQTVAACGKSVWVGSEDDGLAVRGVSVGSRNGRSDWHHVNVLDGLPEDWVMATACAGDRSAWVGTYRSGVGRVDARGWSPVLGLQNAWVQALAVDGDTLWVGTADGLYRVVDETVELVSIEDVWSILPEDEQILLGTRTGLVALGRP